MPIVRTPEENEHEVDTLNLVLQAAAFCVDCYFYIKKKYMQLYMATREPENHGTLIDHCHPSALGRAEKSAQHARRARPAEGDRALIYFLRIEKLT